MSMTVKTIPLGNILRVVCAGEFSLDEAKRAFLEMIKSIEKHRCTKVLFDGREIAGDPTIIDRFYYAEFAARCSREASGNEAAPQFAYVLREPVLDPQRLGETVAINRGMNVKVFDNLGEAVEWLGLVHEEIGDLHITARRDVGP